MNRHIRMSIKILVILIVLIMTLVAGFLAGQIVSGMGFRSRDNYEVMMEAKRFESLVNKVNEYLSTHDGWMPVDAYGGFVEAGVVDSFNEFIMGDLIVFDSFNLPPRVNPVLEKNVKAPLFWLFKRETLEIWVAYMDGTWERESRSRLKFITGAPSKFGQAQVSWYKAFHDAGYPYWTSFQEKADWIRKEKDHLVWDDAKRMYMPRAIVPTTVTSNP